MIENIEKLYEQAVFHRTMHDCSAYPYENGNRLIAAIHDFQPLKILEIGTGMGYTATLMALSAPKAHIDTIEKDPEHVAIAKRFTAENGIADNRITFITDSAEIHLEKLTTQYDFIFFDGYQIHYEFLPQYERLLSSKGILFLGNNHLKSKTSDQFFEGLNYDTKWKIIDSFADTTIAQRV